jgi:hypothetical protein
MFIIKKLEIKQKLFHVAINYNASHLGNERRRKPKGDPMRH